MDLGLPGNSKLLREIIESKNISTLFQPIVDLKSTDIIGYEALSRGPENTPLFSPISLILQAEQDGTLWLLEELFREKAIQKANELELKSLLFLNVDPNVINDSSFIDGFTREYISKYGMTPERIVIEITERSAIENYKSFRAAIAHYTGQGYKMAIDDTGAGYSNMSMISKIKPNFIKIDIDLVRDIDKDSFKQAIIKSFVWLANLTSTKLIAEGIETMGEARTLLSLGVHAGQGFFLGRPSPVIAELNPAVKSELSEINRSSALLHTYSSKYIGEICESINAFDVDTNCLDIKTYFDSYDVEGACILSRDSVAGLIMRSRLNAAMSAQYGFSLHANKPVGRIMDTSFLTVDYNTPISTVSELALARPHTRIYDNIIVTRNFRYAGIVSVINLLKHSLDIERSYALELNPLTGLPGNMQINKVLFDIINNGTSCSVMYIDLDNFKFFNDSYGFRQGDAMLILAKDVICNAVKSRYSFSSFIGQIGGDDFLAVVNCTAEECEALSGTIIECFNREVRCLFSEEDLARGYIIGRSRSGGKTPASAPLTSVSVAALCGTMTTYNSPDSLAFHLSELKSAVKSTGGSNFIVMQTGEDSVGEMK